MWILVSEIKVSSQVSMIFGLFVGVHFEGIVTALCSLW